MPAMSPSRSGDRRSWHSFRSSALGLSRCSVPVASAPAMTPPSTITSPREPIRTPRDTIGMPMILVRGCGPASTGTRRRGSSPSSCRSQSTHCGCRVQRLVQPRRSPICGHRRTRARRRCGGRSARSGGRGAVIVAHCSIWRSPSELPNAAIGRRPMCSLMPTGLPGPSSMKSISGRRTGRACRLASRTRLDA